MWVVTVGLCCQLRVILLQKEFTVYVDKNGLVQDLLSEAAKEVCCMVGIATSSLMAPNSPPFRLPSARTVPTN